METHQLDRDSIYPARVCCHGQRFHGNSVLHFCSLFLESFPSRVHFCFQPFQADALIRSVSVTDAVSLEWEDTISESKWSRSEPAGASRVHKEDVETMTFKNAEECLLLGICFRCRRWQPLFHFSEVHGREAGDDRPPLNEELANCRSRQAARGACVLFRVLQDCGHQ